METRRVFPVLRSKLEPLFELDDVLNKPSAPSESWCLKVTDRITRLSHIVSVCLVRASAKHCEERIALLRSANGLSDALIRIDDAYTVPSSRSSYLTTAVVVTEAWQGSLADLLGESRDCTFDWFEVLFKRISGALRALHSLGIVHGRMSLEALCCRASGAVILRPAELVHRPGTSFARDLEQLSDIFISISKSRALARCSSQCVDLVLNHCVGVSPLKFSTSSRIANAGTLHRSGKLSDRAVNVLQTPSKISAIERRGEILSNSPSGIIGSVGVVSRPLTDPVYDDDWDRLLEAYAHRSYDDVLPSASAQSSSGSGSNDALLDEVRTELTRAATALRRSDRLSELLISDPINDEHCCHEVLERTSSAADHSSGGAPPTPPETPRYILDPLHLDIDAPRSPSKLEWPDPELWRPAHCSSSRSRREACCCTVM